jgi:pSer/pThr/pTyr-binding forkhead associated (FHA) protein
VSRREDGDGREPGLILLSPGDRLRIGRHTSNDVVLDHPSVSRFHAVLAWPEGDRPSLEDLASLNGSWVDGAPCHPRASIGEESLVEVGELRLFVRRAPPALVPAADGGCRVYGTDQATSRGALDGPGALRRLLLTLEAAGRSGTLVVHEPA